MRKKSWKKGALIGGIVFVVLVLIYIISGWITPCIMDGGVEGSMCTNYFQDRLLAIFFILSFPSLLFEIGNPNVSSVGPIGVAIFWITGFIISAVIGAVIGLIVQKIRKR